MSRRLRAAALVAAGGLLLLAPASAALATSIHVDITLQRAPVLNSQVLASGEQKAELITRVDARWEAPQTPVVESADLGEHYLELISRIDALWDAAVPVVAPSPVQAIDNGGRFDGKLLPV